MIILWQGKPVLTSILLLISLGLGIKYYYNLNSEKKLIKWILPSLRFFSFLLLSLLLAQPYFTWNQIVEKRQKINLFIDKSMSMENQIVNSLEFNNSIKVLSDSLMNKNGSIELFEFSNNVNNVNDINDIVYNGTATDFTPLIEIINYRNNDLNVLITDGIETQGIELNSFAKLLQNPIFTLGIGNTKIEEDLKIESIDYQKFLMKDDSLNLSVSISIAAYNNVQPVLLFKNSKGIVFRKQIEFKKGNYKQDIDLKLSWYDLENINEIQLISEIDERNKKNNSRIVEIVLVENSRQISMISGAISENTPILKQIITSIPRTKLNHTFRINNYWKIKWNKIIDNQTQLVILDDFPSKTSDLNNFEELTMFLEQNKIPFIYFAGVSNNKIVRSKIANYFDATYESFKNPEPKSISDKIIPISWKNGLPSDLPPVLLSGSWQVKPSAEALLIYHDESAAILVRGKNSAILIEELNSLNLQYNYINHPVDLAGFLYQFIKSNIKLDMSELNIELMDSEVYLGETVKINYFLNPNYSKNKIDNLVEITNEENDVIFLKVPDIENDSASVSFTPDNFGKLSIKGIIVDNSKDTIWSNPIELTIPKLHVENKQTIQNVQGLKSLAENTGGVYLHYEKMDSLINYLPLKSTKINETKHAGIYDLQNYWILLIVLLISEWIIRKKTGLL